VGPDATGAAAFGLCNAFTHGGLNPTSTAYDALAEAAGGESGIATYCETVPAPRDAADDEGDRTAAGDSGQLAEQQEVEEQRHGPAPASNDNAGQQPNNVSKQPVNRQR
jgi:hypothetical protein